MLSMPAWPARKFEIQEGFLYTLVRFAFHAEALASREIGQEGLAAGNPRP